MTLNEWLASIGTPEMLRKPIFHPNADKKEEIFKKYPDSQAFFDAYGFQPEQGWYDPQTAKPILLQDTNPIKVGAAEAMRKAFNKGAK